MCSGSKRSQLFLFRLKCLLCINCTATFKFIFIWNLKSWFHKVKHHVCYFKRVNSRVFFCISFLDTLFTSIRKWLRYYLDFCQKYQHPYADENSLLLFLDKLLQKNQPADQCDQAQKAVRLYYSGLGRENDPQTGIVQNSVAEAGRSFDIEQPISPWSGAMDL